MKYDLQLIKKDVLETLNLITAPETIPNAEVAYDSFFKGYGGKSEIRGITQFLNNLLYENGYVHLIDWKWNFEDELYILKELLPNTPYQELDLVQDDEFKLTGTIVVNGLKYVFEKADEYKFLEILNCILMVENSPKRILVYEYSGDTLEYHIVEKGSYDRLADYRNEFLDFLGI